jgi:hypothetical protein
VTCYGNGLLSLNTLLEPLRTPLLYLVDCSCNFGMAPASRNEGNDKRGRGKLIELITTSESPVLKEEWPGELEVVVVSLKPCTMRGIFCTRGKFLQVVAHGQRLVGVNKVRMRKLMEAEILIG